MSAFKKHAELFWRQRLDTEEKRRNKEIKKFIKPHKRMNLIMGIKLGILALTKRINDNA